MTWMAFDGDEPISGSDSDDPGMCMLYLMSFKTEETSRDYVRWLDMRRERTENAIRALYDPAVASKLKEEYLEFVSRYAEKVGYFKVLYSTITIKWVDMEGEE